MRLLAVSSLFTPRVASTIVCVALAFLGVAPVFGQPTDARVKEILTQRIDVDKQAVGIAVVITEGANVRVVTHGHTSLNKTDAITGDTLFEVGSITKTFTTLLLADMVLKGEVKLDDPVERWLPQGVLGLKLRDHTGAPIRLVDLATHRSGLPRLPNNMVNGTSHDPYVDYREQQLLLYLKEREVAIESDGGKTTKKRDEAYAYSNLGMGLLGYTLARAANTTYANLLQTRVLTPLGLTSTYLTVPRSETGRYSAGHYLDKGVTLRGARHWRFDVIAPAGALSMSAKDIARYGQAASGAIDTPLREAFELAQKRYGDGISPMNPTGLAWILAPLNGRTVVNHDGMTGGFAASLWVDPERKSSVAVLSNASAAVLDIGLHLIEPSIPLKNLAAMRAIAVAVDAKLMAQYVGTYALSPSFSVTIRLRDGKLFGQATGQGEFEIFGKNNSTFFARITPLEIVFEDVKDGKAGSFSLTQGGNTRKATRVE
ncbi:MAG: serine hydrolase [Burkholderiales bacterium]|nr:serine hydrolase [Burkholderiales bacterium]